jgi:hypothetical protein
METDLIPVKPDGTPKYSTLNDYKALVNTNPRPSWVRQNKYSQNAKYLPIRIVEELLSEIFPAWQARQIGEPKILGNSVVISVELQVYHPIFGQWLTYPGVGAVPIELERGATPTDFTKINPKALHKNVPAALSFAISNAAKKIGPLFGSRLNNDPKETIK